MKDKVIGLIWRFGNNDYQISLTQYDDKDQEVLQDIETRYGDADRNSCVRGDENLTIKDANIEYWEREWSKGKKKKLRTFIFVKTYKEKSFGIRGKVRRCIVGMEQGTMFPSCQNDKESQFYGCQCIEVSEHCHVELGDYIE